MKLESRYLTCCAKAEVALKLLPAGLVDSLVCDPPGGISFMGKEWDTDHGGWKEWICVHAPIFRECLRVLKPGAHGLVWALPKTSHWTAVALELAGFEIRDIVHHWFATGYPKSPNVLKPACEHWIKVRKPFQGTVAQNVAIYGTGALNIRACEIGRASDDVPGWHQSGAKGSEGYLGSDTYKIHDMSPEEIQERRGDKGRWPAHLILSHSDLCVQVGTRKVKGCPAVVTQGGKDGGGYDPGSGDGTRRGTFEGYGDADGMEEVEEWACVPGCPVRMLDTQAGPRAAGHHPKRRNGKSMWAGEGGGLNGNSGPERWMDSGSASRFFFQPKPSRRERDEGLLGVIPCHKCGGLETKEHDDPEGRIDEKTGTVRRIKCLRNPHPTLKGIALMQYLIRLITPPRVICCPSCSVVIPNGNVRSEDMRRVPAPVCSETQGTDSVLNRLPQQAGVSGPQPEKSTTSVPDLQCKAEEGSRQVLLDQVSSTSAEDSFATLSTMSDSISGSQRMAREGAEVLLARVRQQGDDHAGGEVLRELQPIVSPKGEDQSLLFSEMCGAGDREAATGNWRKDGRPEGLHSTLDARASDGLQARLPDGASLCDGAVFGAPSVSQGSCSPPKRHQERQSHREFGIDAQEGARSLAQTTAEADPVPTLWRDDRSLGACKACGSPLIEVPGTVLDPFMGSGTTGVAALWEGMQFLGIEQEEPSHTVARARLAWASKEIKF